MSYSAYLETQILSASPVELVAIMYRTAIGSLESARIHLATGDIAARSTDISRAMALINELSQSIDPTPDRDFAARLGDLYAYILAKIQEGNFQQSDAPLSEAIRLLNTMLDGWQEIDPGTQHRDVELPCPDNYQPLQCSF